MNEDQIEADLHIKHLKKCHTFLKAFVDQFNPEEYASPSTYSMTIAFLASCLLGSVHNLQEYIDGCLNLNMTEEQILEKEEIIAELILNSFECAIQNARKELFQTETTCQH